MTRDAVVTVPASAAAGGGVPVHRAGSIAESRVTIGFLLEWLVTTLNRTDNFGWARAGFNQI